MSLIRLEYVFILKMKSRHSGKIDLKNDEQKTDVYLLLPPTKNTHTHTFHTFHTLFFMYKASLSPTEGAVNTPVIPWCVTSCFLHYVLCYSSELCDVLCG